MRKRHFRIQGEGVHNHGEVDHTFKKFGNEGKERKRVAEGLSKMPGQEF